MRKTNFKGEKGITLIALVITIIVLLILAGVAISMLSGENGILSQAAKAKEETEKASLEEEIQLAYLSTLKAGTGEVDYGVLNAKLAELGFDRGAYDETAGTYENDIKGLPAMVEIDGVEYTITTGGKVAKSGTWAYKRNGTTTIVTNGAIELKIGDYINYSATKDEDGNDIEEYTETSKAGSPTDTEDYTATSKTLTEGNGYGDRTYSNKISTNGWRVLGVDEEKGEILIVSADAVKDKDGNTFGLRGIAGYTYGESELDKVCGVFGHGYGATGARSIDVEDVNKITGYNPNNTGDYDPEQTKTGTVFGDGYLWKYGNQVKYTWNTTTSGKVDYQVINVENGLTGSLNTKYISYGFNWYDMATKTWNSNTTKSGEITMLTINRYCYNSQSLTDADSLATNGIKIDSSEFKTLFRNEVDKSINYLLASFYIGAADSGANFGVRSVIGTGTIWPVGLYSTVGGADEKTGLIRPVVSLKSDIKLQYDKTNGYYNIK